MGGGCHLDQEASSVSRASAPIGPWSDSPRDWGRRILLIAQTGWGQDEDKRRTREAGFDAHLVKPTDPVTYLVVTGVLGGVALLASSLPALRAARIDPALAMRGE